MEVLLSGKPLLFLAAPYRHSLRAHKHCCICPRFLQLGRRYTDRAVFTAPLSAPTAEMYARVVTGQ